MAKYKLVLQALFTIFREENYIREEIFLPFRDSLIHNSPVGLVSVFQLLRDSDVVPCLLSTDKVLDLCNAVCCTKSELSAIFYKRRDMRNFHSLKETCKHSQQTSKIDFVLSSLANDPKCFFFEFCLLMLLLSYVLAKAHTSKRDPESLFTVFMREVLCLGTDDQLSSNVFEPSTDFAKNVHSRFLDCFNENRQLKKEYSGLFNPDQREPTEPDKAELSNSIRVNSILSTASNPRLLLYFQTENRKHHRGIGSVPTRQGLPESADSAP